MLLAISKNTEFGISSKTSYNTNMTNEIEKIQRVLHKNRDTLRTAYKVNRLGIFGSIARGESVDVSDIDVIVEFSEPVGLFLFLELENYLVSILGKKVDLVTPNALKSAIKTRVLKETIYVS